jgi:hypothetical protein
VAQTQSHDNGRITLAILATKLDTVIRQQDDLLVKFEVHLQQSAMRDTRIALLDNCTGQLSSRVAGIDGRLDDMRVKTTWWSGINSALATIAAVIAAAFR